MAQGPEGVRWVGILGFGCLEEGMKWCGDLFEKRDGV